MVGWSQLVRRRVHRARPGASSGCTRRCFRVIAAEPRFPGRSSPASATTGVTLFEIADPTADSGPIVGQVEVPVAYRRHRYDPLRAACGGARRSRPGASSPLCSRRRHHGLRKTRAGRARGRSGAPRRDHRLGHAGAVPLRLGARADAPYPGAFTFLGDTRIVVWRASPIATRRPATPGPSSRNGSQELSSPVGRGLLLEEVEADGAEPVVAADVASVTPVGARLG